MLALDRATYDAIVAHARADFPDEACGLVAMRDGHPTRVIPMLNTERSPTFYVMDGGEVLKALRTMRDLGEDDEDFVVYHSHTATEAYPSRTDVSLLAFPEAHYLIVSVRDPVAVEARSFRISTDGDVTEEEVTVQ